MIDALWLISALVWIGAAGLAVRNVWLRYAYARERRVAARADHEEFMEMRRARWRDPLPPVFDRPWSEWHLKRGP